MKYTANVKVPTIQIEMEIDTSGNIDTYEVVGFAFIVFLLLCLSPQYRVAPDRPPVGGFDFMPPVLCCGYNREGWRSARVPSP